MNSPELAHALEAPPLGGLAFALLARQVQSDAAVEAQWLAGWRDCAPPGANGAQLAWRRWSQAPPASDLALHALATELDLSAAEVFAVALAAHGRDQPPRRRLRSRGWPHPQRGAGRPR